MKAQLPFDTHLNDGTDVHIRAILPEDRCLLSEGFEKLSPASRFMRFLGPHPTLTETDLDTFTAPNDADHFAIGAMAGRTPVATARFVRLSAPEKAELALTIVDDYQGLGLGGLLLHTLSEIAREQGITQFLALTHSQNRAMQSLLMRHGAQYIGAEGAEREMQLDLNGPIKDPIYRFHKSCDQRQSKKLGPA